MDYPTVTQILNVINKPWLAYWGAKIGREGKTVQDALKEAQDLGTMLHKYVYARLTGSKFEEKNLSEDFYICKGKIDKWIKKQGKMKVYFAEKRFYSKQYLFSGQPDLVILRNGKVVLVDFKTSKSFYLSHEIQISAYKYLLEENNVRIDKLEIVQVSKYPEQDLEILEVSQYEYYWNIFIDCLLLYRKLDLLDYFKNIDLLSDFLWEELLL